MVDTDTETTVITDLKKAMDMEDRGMEDMGTEDMDTRAAVTTEQATREVTVNKQVTESCTPTVW